LSELDWAAGFFDGEGWIGVKPVGEGKGWYLALSISQMRPEPLERFSAALGLGAKVRGPYSSRGAEMWQYALHGDGARKAVRLLRPLVSAPKREQIDEALIAVRRARSHANRNKTHCKRGHAFTLENTYVRTDGGRACRICTRARQRARRGA
jgi:hypothetical protein